MRNTSRSGRIARRVSIVALVVALGACAPQFSNHGYIPPQEDLDQIKVGADTRDTVAEKVGVPASSGVLNESGYYYVRSRKRSIGPLPEREIDRQVVAISFSSNGVVQNVERFGLERGQVVPLSRRVTSSPVNNQTFLRQLLGNIGRLAPAGFSN
ncbi:outer membrane protein assembly factor BamE [Sulfitobacter sp. JB4-11]|uniref:outer membrane protein assembly factor BamE n=1 Tax=Sulfitobacter rhodophyticola TaxID=3238304 RepID=UPI003515C892